MIENYFELVKKEITKSKWLTDQIKIESEYDEDINIGLIGGCLTFRDGSIFHFKEVFAGEIRRYRFHYMDKNNNMIFRWDNAPHYKNLRNFPHHVHYPDGVKESEPVEFVDILRKVENTVIKRLNEM